MKKWANRSPEVAALLNPAFCGLLISVGLDEYLKSKEDGAPYVFPFIMLPLVLHKPSRHLFPRTTRTAFSTWITNADTARAKIGFAERSKNMVPYVKEALIFSIQNKYIHVTDSGLLKPQVQSPQDFSNATPEVKECIRASKMFGKWFSMVGDFKTVMALLGIRP